MHASICAGAGLIFACWALPIDVATSPRPSGGLSEGSCRTGVSDGPRREAGSAPGMAQLRSGGCSANCCQGASGRILLVQNLHRRPAPIDIRSAPSNTNGDPIADYSQRLKSWGSREPKVPARHTSQKFTSL